MRHNFADKKYTVVFDEETALFEALRHGEPWRDLCGDGLILAMLQEVDHLKEQLAAANAWIPCADRLPEADGEYIAHYKWSDKSPFAAFNDSAQANNCVLAIFRNGHWQTDTRRITHWRAKPTPPPRSTNETGN